MHGCWPKIVLCLLGLVGAHAVASTLPPHEYYVLSPEPLTGALSLMSLEPNTTITFGSKQVTLNRYETATVPATLFSAGSKFSGTGFFTVGSNEDAADLLAPDDFAGTAFVVPHIAGAHRYFFLSPSGTAQVTIQVGADTYQFNAAEGVVNEFDAGEVNGLAGRITSDVPIVLTHVAYSGGAAIDAYPVAPAAEELFGIRSQETVVAALGDGTSVTVYASDSTSASYTLNAGEQVTVTAGASGTQGQGSALRVVADAPIAAVQYDDGDGNDVTAFWTIDSFGRRYGLPVDAQYVSVACADPNVTLTLYKGANAPETQTCSGSLTAPGTASFGSTVSGPNLSAGWYVISSSPVYLMYEAASPEDEHNLLGLSPLPGPAAPVLNDAGSSTGQNPMPVSGTAGANQPVHLYVNGLLQATTVADGSGNYSFNAILIDDTNTLYTTAVENGNESDPSNAVSVDYHNYVSRNQSGTISGTVVWTPGNPAQPYTVAAAGLTVAAGAQLIIQPGTQIRFASVGGLSVSGTLTVNGSAAANVTFTSNQATPTRGSWPGLRFGTGSNVTLNHALVEWASSGIRVSNGATFVMTNSTVRNFRDSGVVFENASTSRVANSIIDNSNDVGHCFDMTGSAAPTIQDNRVSNCQYGFYLTANGSGGPQPIVTGNQITSHGSGSVHTTSGSYPVNSFLTLDFTGNWWGTTDLTALANSISDVADNPIAAAGRAAVDYSGFLNGPNGTAVPGNFLSTYVSGNTTLAGNTTYEMMGALIVTYNGALTIEPGATLRFYATTATVRVLGTLQAGGTGAQVLLTSGKSSPTRGSWGGVQSNNGANLSLDNVRIEWAAQGISAVNGAAFAMNNTTIRNFSESGIVFDRTNTASVSNSIVDNLNDVGDCVRMLGAAVPTIQGTLIANCKYGVYLTAWNNAGPQPVVSGGNRILSHGTYSVYADSNYPANSFLTLNFTNNWWGTTDLGAIANAIYDLSDHTPSTTLPTVNFGNPLNAASGTPMPGNFVGGALTGNSTLAANTTYEVMGSLLVPAGATLDIQPGAMLRFHAADAVVRVAGSLQIVGGGTPVTLTSGKPSPTRGSWGGIEAVAGASVSLDNVSVEWAANAIRVRNDVTFTLTNGTIRNFSNSGLAFSGASTSSVSNSTIDNLNDAANCVSMSGASAPTIQNSVIANCFFGFYLTAVNFPGPQPVVSAGNQILSHGSRSVFVEDDYPANSSVVLNFTNNWWGTADSAAIAAAIMDLTDTPTSTKRPTVDFSNPLAAPPGN
ncbi:MAG TPA: right-handed parallel beta-helix repeat-containing protein [Steroidobacter sp.]|uniref:right-handed parallel beta-helix repeat-containing protein n=1 Tax=Steroidobacter sp. TaxID=1978227 RepID=UPI002ED78756